MQWNIYRIKWFCYSALVIGLNSCNYSPGSYPYAERYEIDMSEDELIDRLKTHKELHPELKLPAGVNMKDGKRNNVDHWHHFYFYRKESDQVVKTWVRRIDEERSTFALVALFDRSFQHGLKFFNKDFDDEENEILINRFEEELLTNIVDPSCCAPF
ncbi:hypothetical protein [Reichenbachiella sp.]